MVKNFFAVTMHSLGLPMISMGDEVRRTQQGNNNPYCQDNPIAWMDWNLVEKHAGLLRFVTMLHFQRHLKHVAPEQQRRSLSMLLRQGDGNWHGVKLGQPDWGANSHSLALSVANGKTVLCST
jgi:isoamylase